MIRRSVALRSFSNCAIILTTYANEICSCFDVYILLFLSFCVYITQRNPNKNKNVIFYTQKRFHSLQLRNGQSVCTDNECTDLVSPQTGGPGANPADSFTWMMFMMIAAVILYLIRPNSLRRRENDGSNKSSRDDVSESFPPTQNMFKLFFQRPPHDPQPPMAN